MRDFLLQNPELVLGSNVVIAIILAMIALLRGWSDSIHGSRKADKDLAVGILQDEFGVSMRKLCVGYKDEQSGQLLLQKEKEERALRRSVKLTRMIAGLEWSHGGLRLSIKSAFIVSLLVVLVYMIYVAMLVLGIGKSWDMTLLVFTVLSGVVAVFLCLVGAAFEFYFLGSITKANKLSETPAGGDVDV